MPKNNSTKKKLSGWQWFGVIVSILLVVTLVASLLTISRTTNGFTEMPVFEDSDVGFVCEADCECCSDGVCNCDMDDCLCPNCSCSGSVDLYDLDGNPYNAVVQFSILSIPYEDFDEYGIQPYAFYASSVTASVTPSDANIYDAYFELTSDPYFVGKDANGQDWSKGSTSTYLSHSDVCDKTSNSYVSNVSCLAPFGCTYYLTLHLTDYHGNEKTASCSLNYKSYLQSEVVTLTNIDSTYGYSDSFGSFKVNYDVDSSSYSLSDQSDSSVALDVEHMVYASDYTLNLSVSDFTYTVGSISCSDAFPSVSFLLYDSTLSFSLGASSWSTITNSLLGTAFGDGYFGEWNSTMFSSYDSSSPWMYMQFTCGGSDVMSFGIYPVNFDNLFIDISDLVLSDSEIIFG